MKTTYGSGPCIVPTYASRKYRDYSGNRHSSAYCRYLLVVPILSQVISQALHRATGTTQPALYCRGVTQPVPVLNGCPLISGGKYPGTREYLPLYWAGIRVPVQHPGTRTAPGYPGHYFSEHSVLNICCAIATTLKTVVAQRVQDSA